MYKKLKSNMNYQVDEILVNQAQELLQRSFAEVSEPAGGKGYRVEHALRVKNYLHKFLQNAELADQKIDTTALLVAGLLHDIGDIRKVVNGSIDYSVEINHPQAGAEIAKQELSSATNDSELVNKVATIILNHHNYSDDVSIETKLLQDADQIDELGQINFWQMFQFSYHKARNLTDTIAYWHMDGIKRKEQCISTCHFNFTHELAQRRLNKMKEMIAEIETEVILADLS